MTPLTEFLLARIAEDEAVAREAAEHRTNTSSYDISDMYLRHGQVAGTTWRATYDEVYAWTDDERGKIAAVGNFGSALTKHIARHDPARVLAECEAKRGIVEALVDAERDVAGYDDDEPHSQPSYWQDWANRHALALAAECLALPYADHPDYREEWKP